MLNWATLDVPITMANVVVTVMPTQEREIVLIQEALCNRKSHLTYNIHRGVEFWFCLGGLILSVS